MAIDEHARYALHREFERVFGEEHAMSLIDELSPLGNEPATSAEMNARFADMDARFADMDARFDRLEERWDLRFRAMEQRLEGVEQRIDGFEQRIDQRIERQTDRFIHWVAGLMGMMLAFAVAMVSAVLTLA